MPTIRSCNGHIPEIHETAFIAPGAVVVGKVSIGPGASVWYNAVLRGDLNAISVGAGSNLQDGCVVHVDADSPVVIGEDCIVGHQVVLHGCTLEPGCLVGMGSTILDHAVIGRGALVGAGSLVTRGMKVEAGFLYLGSPARKRRPVSPEEKDYLEKDAAGYRELAREHSRGDY